MANKRQNRQPVPPDAIARYEEWEEALKELIADLTDTSCSTCNQFLKHLDVYHKTKSGKPLCQSCYEELVEILRSQTATRYIQKPFVFTRMDNDTAPDP